MSVKELAEYETIRVKFAGRDEYLEISGNGEVQVDCGESGEHFRMFSHGGEDPLLAQGSMYDNETCSLPTVEPTWKYTQYLQILLETHKAGHECHKEIGEVMTKLHALIMDQA